MESEGGSELVVIIASYTLERAAAVAVSVAVISIDKQASLRLIHSHALCLVRLCLPAMRLRRDEIRPWRYIFPPSTASSGRLGASQTFSDQSNVIARLDRLSEHSWPHVGPPFDSRRT
jgi:hypothetical protein